MRPRRLGPLAVLALVVLAFPAAGLVVDGSKPSHSEHRPANDPGWRNVGERKGRSAVYLGGGWVLTAGHVGAGPVTFEGVEFMPVPGSAVQLDAHAALGRKADLVVFRVDPPPALPPLKLRKSPVREGTPLLMIGYGRGRGEPAGWGGARGFQWTPGAVKRWGTNQARQARVELEGPGDELTICFRTDFSTEGTHREAQATPGDSGGAVFARGASLWRLAGVMLAVESRSGQPKNQSLYGNKTRAADLFYYREQIVQLMGRKERKRARKGEPSTPAGPEPAEPE